MKTVSPKEIKVKTGGHLTLAFGVKGVGKTSFAIDTADVAQPLWYANFDRDATHLLANYKGKEVNYDTFAPTENKVVAQATLKRFATMVNAAKGSKGVFVMDGGHAHWDLVKKAELPVVANNESMYPKEFGDANNNIGWAYTTLEDSDLWPIVICPAVEIWKQATQGSGRYTYQGWNRLGGLIANAVYLFTTGQTEGVPLQPGEETADIQYKARIEVAKLRPQVQGTLMEKPRFKELLSWTKSTPKSS